MMIVSDLSLGLSIHILASLNVVLTITGERSREPRGKKENRCVPTEAITTFRSIIEEETTTSSQQREITYVASMRTAITVCWSHA